MSGKIRHNLSAKIGFVDSFISIEIESMSGRIRVRQDHIKHWLKARNDIRCDFDDSDEALMPAIDAVIEHIQKEIKFLEEQRQELGNWVGAHATSLMDNEILTEGKHERATTG